MRRYVIIGMGAAGIAAAEAIREHDSGGEILPICEEPDGYYSRPGLAYYLTGEINECQVFPFSPSDFRRLKLRPIHTRVTGIDPSRHCVYLQDGQTITFDRLLIATGSSAAMHPLPGITLSGVVKLDNLSDARRILHLARTRQPAVIVGGGITALEIVEGLVARGVKVHYLLRGDRYWRNVLDETESAIVEQRLAEHGVVLHHQTDLAEILGQDGRVIGVRTQEGRVIRCGIVAIAIGVLPRIELAGAAGLTLERGILVNEYLETSGADIFAAGDVAQAYDAFSGKHILDTLWGPAREQGTVAGMNMAGIRTIYRKKVAFNVTRLAGLTTTIIGKVGRGRDDDLVSIARGDSECWRELPDVIVAQDRFEVNRLRLLVDQKCLVGAVVMGDQTLSRPVHELVAHGADIAPIRKYLLQPQVSLTELIAQFWTSWKQSHATQSS